MLKETNEKIEIDQAIKNEAKIDLLQRSATDDNRYVTPATQLVRYLCLILIFIGLETHGFTE